MELPTIETFDNEYADRNYLVEHEFPEFTCVCPKTGLPDFATIRVKYTPDKKCVELKSLKMYLIAFRDKGVFHEHVVNRILEDFTAATRPRRAFIEGDFNVRGGVGTNVKAEYHEPPKPTSGTAEGGGSG